MSETCKGDECKGDPSPFEAAITRIATGTATLMAIGLTAGEASQIACQVWQTMDLSSKYPKLTSMLGVGGCGNVPKGDHEKIDSSTRSLNLIKSVLAKVPSITEGERKVLRAAVDAIPAYEDARKADGYQSGNQG